MAWKLTVWVLDVGQGDSSLIIAEDDKTGQARTLLIDGGRARYAETVHSLVRRFLRGRGIPELDHILVSTYNRPHHGGLLQLLNADNLYHFAHMVAYIAVREAGAGDTTVRQIAGGVAGAYAACRGGYESLPQNPGLTAQVRALATGARLAANAGDANPNAAMAAWTYVTDPAHPLDPRLLNPTLIYDKALSQNIACIAGLSAGAFFQAAQCAGTVPPEAVQVQAVGSVRDMLLHLLFAKAPAGARFDTGGFYANTHIIDISARYQSHGFSIRMGKAAAGGLSLETVAKADWLATAPGISRKHTTLPALGAEILWNSGPRKAPPPAGAPAVFVVARAGEVWDPQSPGKSSVIPPDNPPLSADTRIGLVVRFNDFVYYTGGDLTSPGEDLIASAVTRNGLPNPGGDSFPAVDKIACFKCGRHGHDTATSDNFLSMALPAAALISCGTNPATPVPSQSVIDRLQADYLIDGFYLTNCNVARNHVPKSFGLPQTGGGNKSRVSGDNALPNDGAGRIRGHLIMQVGEAGTRAGNRTFTVMHRDAVGNMTSDTIDAL
jgi:hypothetical protein